MIGLLADPDLPLEVARRLADDLPDALTRAIGDRWSWRVEVGSDRLDVEEVPPRRLAEAAARHRRDDGWQLTVFITDMPQRSGLRPVLTDASVPDGVALLSLPALGAVRVHQRACRVIVHLVAELLGDRQRPQGGHRVVPAARRVDHDDGARVKIVGAGLRGYLRLLAGMVRDNRPWRLVRGLSRSLVAALATAAVAVVTSDIWRLADSLGPLRLALISLGSVGAMVMWLIVDHGLWERPSDERARDKAVLFNVTTALTLALGVLVLYLALVVGALALAGLLIVDSWVEQALSHPGRLDRLPGAGDAGQLDRHHRWRPGLGSRERPGGPRGRLRLPPPRAPRPAGRRRRRRGRFRLGPRAMNPPGWTP